MELRVDLKRYSKYSLGTFLLSIAMLMAINPVSAIQEDNETPKETTPTINKNILTPNESPGMMTDTEKTIEMIELIV